MRGVVAIVLVFLVLQSTNSLSLMIENPKTLAAAKESLIKFFYGDASAVDTSVQYTKVVVEVKSKENFKKWRTVNQVELEKLVEVAYF